MERKTVADDALISTDIDHIISYLSEKKRVEMRALSRELGIKQDSLKKWITILEAEGYVDIQYHLLSEYVVWAGAEPLPMPETQEKKFPSESELSKSIKEQVSEPEPKLTPEVKSRLESDVEAQFGSGESELESKAGLNSELESELKSEIESKLDSDSEEKPEPEEKIQEHLPEPEHEELKAEERLERIMARANLKQEKEDDITKSIISSFSDEEENAPEVPKAQEEEKPERKHLPFEKTDLQQEMEKVSDEEPEKPEPVEKARGELASLKRSLSEYMEQIRVQKEDIEKLKREREGALAKLYLPLEERFKASYDTIAEKLLEKEGKLIELKERLAEFPAKVEDAAKVEAALRRIRLEAKRSFAANKDGMEHLKKALDIEDSRLRNGISSMEKDIKARKSDMLDLSNAVASMNSREQDIKKGIDSLNAQLSHINEGIAASYAALSAVGQKRTELSTKLGEMQTSLDARASDVVEAYSHLEEVRKAENAIDEYLSDYQKKIAEVEEYVQQSGSELAKVREFAEMKYMRTYMKELDSLASSYEDDYQGAKVQEQSLDERIKDAKANLENLVRESRDLVKSIEGRTAGKSFVRLMPEIRAKQETMIATMREKSAEREKIETGYPSLRRAAEKPSKKAPAKKKKKKK